MPNEASEETKPSKEKTSRKEDTVKSNSYQSDKLSIGVLQAGEAKKEETKDSYVSDKKSIGKIRETVEKREEKKDE